MKTVIIIFLVSFVMMFCVGFGSHWSSPKEPDSLKDYAFSHVKILQKDNKCVFTYGLKDKILYWYDIDENTLHEEPIKTMGDSLFQYSFINDMFLKKGHLDLLLDPDLIRALSPRVTKDILFALIARTSFRTRNVIASVLGRISGYSLGDWVATKALLPSFDSPEIIRIVDSKYTWIEWEASVLTHFLFETKNMIHDLDEGDEKDTHTKAFERIFRSIIDGNDFGSSDLNSLLSLYRTLKYN